MGYPLGGLPGIRSDRSSAHRTVLLTPDFAMFLPKSITIDGTKSRDPLNTGDIDVLRAGLLMGKITASGKYAPSILGVSTHPYEGLSSNDVRFNVSAATATEIARRIGTTGTFKVTGPPTAAGTVATQTFTYSAVNTTTGIITVTDVGADFITGSFIQPTDGSETPLSLLVDPDGIKVTDEDATSQDQPLNKLLVGGLLDASQIINYPSDSSLAAWVKSELRAVGVGFSFDDDF